MEQESQPVISKSTNSSTEQSKVPDSTLAFSALGKSVQVASNSVECTHGHSRLDVKFSGHPGVLPRFQTQEA